MCEALQLMVALCCRSRCSVEPCDSFPRQPCRVKLCDFGCARKWETKEVPKQRLGRFRTFAGTPAYMSPQVRRQQATAAWRISQHAGPEVLRADQDGWPLWIVQACPANA